MKPRRSPPPFAEYLLRRCLPNDVVARSIRGDLREEFQHRSRQGNANWWYRREALAILAHHWRDRFRKRGTTLGKPSFIKGDSMLRQFWADLRFGARALRRTPGFSFVAIITIAIGIGANTAIFSVVDGVLLEPLPFPESDRLAGIWHTAPGLGYDQFGISPGIYLQYRDESEAFESVGLYRSGQRNLTGDGDPDRVPVGIFTRSMFDVLRAQPRLGRFFSPEEDLPDGPDVVVVSQGLWTRRYGADPELIGRTIQVNGVATEVIGVLPAGFTFPGEDTELWFPAAIDPANAATGNFGWNAIARFKPGYEPADAQAQLTTIVARFPELFADQENLVAFMRSGQFAPLVHTMKEDVVGDLERPLWILLGTVGAVLLIACANVANLVLVRAEGRRRETAVRTALGADRWTLARQSLAESAILSALGGALGIVLAAVGVPLLVRAAPDSLPRLDQSALDGSVLAFTFGLTALTAILFGLVPAYRNVSTATLSSLVQGGLRSSASKERHRMRSGLVVLQTALALVLLIGSGLLVRSFWQLRNVNAGFDARGVVTFRLSLPNAEYPGAAATARFHQQMLERLSAIPGVESAGAAREVPLSTPVSGTAVEVEDKPTPAGELPPMFWFTFAAPGYLETMRIPLLAGRTFERRDHEAEFRNVIVSSTLAERQWPGENPVGKRLRFAGDTTGWHNVIGVVGSVRSDGLREEPTELVYWPLVGPNGDDSWIVSSLTYAVRSNNAAALIPSIRAAVWELNPNLPIASIEMLEDTVARSVARLSFTMLALVIAAGMALALGMIGLYGVLSYVVSQRTRELGVRLALGAQPRDVQRMVVLQGARLAGAGLILGILAAFGLSRFLQGLLYGTPALDPWSFAATSAALLSVGLLASYLPARRAAGVDPMLSMRGE